MTKQGACTAVMAAWMTSVMLTPSGAAQEDRASRPVPGTRSYLGESFEGTPSQTGIPSAGVFHHFAPGADFIHAGATTRAGLVVPGVPAQKNPFCLDVPQVPEYAAVVRVFVQWVWLTDDDTPPPIDVIRINNHAIGGLLSGEAVPDLCWGKLRTVVYQAEFSATDNPIVDGLNEILNATSKPLGDDVLALGEGISILIVYDHPPSSREPYRTVDVYTGLISTTSDPATPNVAAATLDLPIPYSGGPLRFLVNGVDGQTGFGGQAAEDALTVEGASVEGLMSGVYPPPAQPDDAWQGLLGLAPVSNLYDHADGDVSSVVSAPASSLTFAPQALPQLEDCVAHTTAVVSYELQPWSDLGSALGGTLGEPALEGWGSLGEPTANAMRLWNVLPSAAALLFASTAENPIPFKGGTLKAGSWVFVFPATTPPDGVLALEFQLPGAVPPGFQLVLQWAIADTGAPKGVALSNAISQVAL